ncbi:hypothetical protein DFS34DRAFT_673885, partial [Phlyctochytrium arcticum]
KNTSLTLDLTKQKILERFPNGRLQIASCDSYWHIVISNYYAKNLEAMRDTVGLFAAEHRNIGFDRKVYGRNQIFKCFNQSRKKGEYIEGDVPTKHLVLHDFDDDAIDIDTLVFKYNTDEETEIMSRILSVEYNFDKSVEDIHDVMTMTFQKIPTLEEKRKYVRDIRIWVHTVQGTLEQLALFVRMRELLSRDNINLDAN